VYRKDGKRSLGLSRFVKEGDGLVRELSRDVNVGDLLDLGIILRKHLARQRRQRLPQTSALAVTEKEYKAAVKSLKRYFCR